jgi:hypothetical protein
LISGKEGKVPFSSLTDYIDLARAQAALEAAWNDVSTTIPEEMAQKERKRLAYMVATLVGTAENEADLKERALDRFRQSLVA